MMSILCNFAGGDSIGPLPSVVRMIRFLEAKLAATRDVLSSVEKHFRSGVVMPLDKAAIVIMDIAGTGLRSTEEVMLLQLTFTLVSRCCFDRYREWLCGRQCAHLF